MKNYFSKYSFNNATLAQFLEEIQGGGEGQTEKYQDLKLFNE